MKVEDIMEIFKPWIYNDENQAGTKLEVIDASDLPMIADKIAKHCNIADINRKELLKGFASKFNEGLDKGDGIAIMDWMIDDFLEKEEESEDGFWDERCENERKDWNE